MFTHLGWVDVLHGCCSWSVSIGGSDGASSSSSSRCGVWRHGHWSWAAPVCLSWQGVSWVLWTGIWGAWVVSCGFGERDGGGRKQGE